MIRLSKQKLRLFFIGFFLALAIPASTLSWKAYEQLKWETFHQYQLDAQFLAQQIDTTLANAIAKEEARTATDYTFLVLAGNPQAKFVQRSDLSKFPIESDLPGVVGYFQIDEKGQFSSPLLPLASDQSALYGISAEEQLLRSQLVHQVRNILQKNQLVSAESRLDKELPAPPVAVSRTADDMADNEAVEEADLLLESFSAEEIPANSASSDQRRLASGVGAVGKQNADGFNKLLSKKEQAKVSEGLAIRQAEEKQDMQRELVEQKRKRSSKKVANLASQRGNRVEQNYSPQQMSAPAESTNIGLTRDEIVINLFESEIEPFNISLLSSSHLVAYRQVWRNKQRIVQGAILDSNKFYLLALNTAYESSNLPAIATLSIAYGNSVLKTFYGDESKREFSYRSKKLVGEKLFSMPLSAPFNEISLIFNVKEIPAGKGAGFIAMVTLSLMIVLVFGTFLLYRLTLKQSTLAQQQQDFVSSVSHELKTPLTSIRMYGEILKQGWMSDEKRVEYYDYIYQESERLSRLISNVLQISKVNRNTLELDIKPIQISELISLIHSKVDSQVAQSEFELKIKVADTLEATKIAVDIDAFIQIVINLIDNAIKYSAKAKTKEIILEIRQGKKQRLDISVRDFGPGIAKDQLTKIFQLFYRTGNELTRECAGTGIGLALVKELADAMNMKVFALSHGVGAEFVLTTEAQV